MRHQDTFAALSKEPATPNGVVTPRLRKPAIDDRQTMTDRKSMAQACNTFGIAVTSVKLNNDLNPFQIGIYVFLVNTEFFSAATHTRLTALCPGLPR